jgi:demethylmenaquinone methyltransferase/2-methoxy-6-polyprenyl-1,4-benzoquinol methylase
MIPRTPAIVYPAMKSPLLQAQPQKEEFVRSLFDGIAHRYDLLNHLLSCGFDILWRKQAIQLLLVHKPSSVLDLATGTADLAIEAANTLNAAVTGIDISDKMLDIGRKKVQRQGLADRVRLRRGRAEALEFAGESFDAVTAAFGVRNFADVGQGLREMHRVLRPGGTILVLEFSMPTGFLFGRLYAFYFQRILPVVGGLVSRSRSSYQYLPNSVQQFPDGQDFLELLRLAGFAETASYPLTMGIATIYVGTKTS